jgi:hypothetical protein
MSRRSIGLAQGAPSAERPARLNGLLAEATRHPDLVLLLLLILLDIRVLQGVAPSSFTLFELMIWLWCLPWLLGRHLQGLLRLEAGSRRLVVVFGAYVAWALFAATCAVLWRDSTDVLQLTKNIVPGLVLIAFLAVRLRDVGACLLLGDLYLIWAVASCLLGFAQFFWEGPYFKPVLEITKEKLGLDGEPVTNPVVGLMVHPNAFAISILPGVLIGMTAVFLDIRAGRQPRLREVLATLVLVTGLILSQAKGVIAWTAVAFIACNLLPRFRGSAARFLVLAVMNLALLFYSLDQASDDLGSSLSTVQTRWLLWHAALLAMETDRYIALLGDGMGFVHDWSRVIADWTFPSAHSGWVDQALFFGLPGFLTYAAVFWVFFKIMRNPGHFPGHGTTVLARAAEAGVMAYVGLSLFEPTAADVYFVSQLVLVMMLGVATADLARPAAPPEVTRATRLQS